MSQRAYDLVLAELMQARTKISEELTAIGCTNCQAAVEKILMDLTLKLPQELFDLLAKN